MRLACLLFFCAALTACDKPHEKEAKYIKRGNALFEAGDYAGARLEYKNAVKIMPTDAEPRYRLGLIDEAENDPRNAFANFYTAERQNPHYRPALLKLAQYFIAGGIYEQADHRLNTVIADDPEDAEAHALRGAILLRRQEYEGTEKEARRALAKDPANITAVAVLTGLYSAQKDQAKAVATVNDGIAHNPKDVSLLLLKVALYEQASDLNNLPAAYQALFALAPKEEIYRADLARAYVKFGKLDEAEATLRAGVAAMPDNWRMKKDLVDFLGNHRSVDAAEKEIRALMQANPQNDDLYFWLADLYVSHNATDRAVALLQQVIEKDSSDRAGLSARASLARIQFVRGNRALAEKLVTAILDKDRGNQEALFIRAQMAFDLGHYQDTVTDLRGILRDNPKNEPAAQLLAEALLMQGHLDLAIDTLNQLLEVNPANNMAAVRLAQMYHLGGNFKRSNELLTLVTKTSPDYPIAWETKARLALAEKNWADAEAAIKKLDLLKGQHMTAVFLEGQLQDKSGKPGAAIPLYLQVANANPLAPLAEHALSAMVEADFATGHLADAVGALTSLKVESPFISTLLGGVYQKLGKNAEAAAAFDKAIAQHSTSQDPYIAHAELCMHDNKPEDALALLKKAADAVPSDPRALMAAALIDGKIGHYQEAIAIYDALLANNPGMDVAANNLAQIIADYEYNDADALDKARRIAERFSGSNNPLYLDTLGWIYYRQGKLQEAQTVMERVMSAKTPLPPEVHFHYASLLLKIGKTSEAKQELILATVPDAQYPAVSEARKTLQGL